MKSQSLPVSTVALIIVIILVVAAAALFYYSAMNSQKSATEVSSNTAECQSICARIQTANPASKAKAAEAADAFGYCSSGCDKTFACTITLTDGSKIRSIVGSSDVCDKSKSDGWQSI
jgi:uncharacterized protein YpmB